MVHANLESAFALAKMNPMTATLTKISAIINNYG